MSEVNHINPTDETAPRQDSVSLNTLNALFTQLNPGHIEQFYQSYQLWTLQQKHMALLTHIATLQQKIVEHTEQMQGLAPSALALASLTQLQACGVEDIDLLERMLERGEVWLDHTIQLLRCCEQLGVIGSNCTEWCEHALEGAYDWIASIGEDADETSTTLAKIEKTDINAIEDISPQITEELILQKLMSDNEEVNETEEVPVVEVARITQPLSVSNLISLELQPEPVADDQLTSLPLDTEDTETSPGIPVYQPSMELSLNAQSIESLPVEYPQAEEAEPSIFGDTSVIIQETINRAEDSVELEKSSITSIQEEKKPQQEIVASERGFLRNLLVRIWGR